MQKYILLLFLLAAPLSAQVVTDIYVVEPKAGIGHLKNNGEYAFADVVITFDNTKVWYILMTLAKTNGIELYVQDFKWDENGETVISKYGIESIVTSIDEKGINSILINTFSEPHFIDFQSGKNLIIRFFKKSEPKIYFVNEQPYLITSFPVTVAFECKDLSTNSSDSLEHRFFIKAPKSVSSICRYSTDNWSPWLKGDSGSVVLDSLVEPGNYSVKVQSRNRNTGAESKVIETKFKYNKEIEK